MVVRDELKQRIQTAGQADTASCQPPFRPFTPFHTLHTRNGARSQPVRCVVRMGMLDDTSKLYTS